MQRSEAEGDDRRDQHGATRRGLLDREPRQELGALCQRPSPRSWQRPPWPQSRGPARSACRARRRSWRAPASSETITATSPAPLVSPSQIAGASSRMTSEPCDGRGAGGDGGAEGAPAECELELGRGRAGPRRQRGRRPPGSADVATAMVPSGNRRRVEPARHEIALGVADRNAARRDAADDGAEREGREDRGGREGELDPALLAESRRSRAQRIRACRAG